MYIMLDNQYLFTCPNILVYLLILGLITQQNYCFVLMQKDVYIRKLKWYCLRGPMSSDRSKRREKHNGWDGREFVRKFARSCRLLVKKQTARST